MVRTYNYFRNSNPGRATAGRSDRFARAAILRGDRRPGSLGSWGNAKCASPPAEGSEAGSRDHGQGSAHYAVGGVPCLRGREALPLRCSGLVRLSVVLAVDLLFVDPRRSAGFPARSVSSRGWCQGRSRARTALTLDLVRRPISGSAGVRRDPFSLMHSSRAGLGLIRIQGRVKNLTAANEEIRSSSKHPRQMFGFSVRAARRFPGGLDYGSPWLMRPIIRIYDL